MTALAAEFSAQTSIHIKPTLVNRQGWRLKKALADQAMFHATVFRSDQGKSASQEIHVLGGYCKPNEEAYLAVPPKPTTQSLMPAVASFLRLLCVKSLDELILPPHL